MITNDRQYRIAKSQLDSFQKALDTFSNESELPKDVHPRIIQAEKDAISYQSQLLTTDIKEYEDLKSGNIIITEVSDLKELPIVLIRARIANGLTQSELASLLGLKEQQIQKYEAELYSSASLRTLLKVSNSLGITLDAQFQIRTPEQSDQENASRYPIKQMFNRNWFSEFRGSLKEALENSNSLIENLFQKAGIDSTQEAFNRRSIRTASEINNYALNAWYARVLIKARDQELDKYFDKKQANQNWFKTLTTLSEYEDGPKQAVEFLNTSGIRVVFEPHLENTYLDGAALLLDKIYPVIALTLRHDRLDNFWFVLFHELAHIFLHLNIDFDAIFDDLDSHIEGIEKEADSFALNIAIPENIWKKSLVRFNPSADTINNLAKTLNINPALVAGRLRWESQNYYLYNDLLGQGKVRNQFIAELN